MQITVKGTRASSLKGTGFSPYVSTIRARRALAPEGCLPIAKDYPSAAKAAPRCANVMYGLKPVPSKARARLLPSRDYDSEITMDKIAMLTQILAQNPGDAFARYGLAMEHANQGQTDAALAEFDRLLSTHPDYTAGYFMAAENVVNAR